MTARFRSGFVVGKFAPLHLGHEHLVTAARAACDRLLVLSYAHPELPGCPPERRAGWLAARFPFARTVVLAAGDVERPMPSNDAGDQHDDFVAWLLAGPLATRVDAVFTSEAYGDGLAAAIAARQGSPVAHVSVDPGRAAVPISGTAVRADVHGQRAFLAPEVYASFVARVALLGGESSGKSTLARALAARFETAWVHEYGRELWEERGGRLDPPDLLHIAEVQIGREERALLAAHRYLFCDTTPLVTRFYAEWMFGAADPRLVALAGRPYDLSLLCAGDWPFVQDGSRQDPAFRDRQHAYYADHMRRAGVPFVELTGDLEARLAAASAALAALAGRDSVWTES
ncbi:MAG TPA: AAA family ATPase [Kofleriaceae bacterium]|nr:AAA family ATPase [Kofleriaceae bacterium]